MKTGSSLQLRMILTSTATQVRHPEVHTGLQQKAMSKTPGDAIHKHLSTKEAVMPASFGYFKHGTYPVESSTSPGVRTKLPSTDALFTAHGAAARGLGNLGLSFLSLGKYHSHVCLCP